MFRTLVAPSAFFVLVTACTPFEGDTSAVGFAQDSIEEAFPGARITGTGEAMISTGPDTSVLVPFVVQEGMAVAGGDMILGDAETFLNRTAAIGTSGRWDTCEIPYAYDSSLSLQGRQDFDQAVVHWEESTGLRFVENPSATSRIQVQGGNGCSSHVGQVGGAQPLTLSAYCGRGAAIHEIGHAIGLFHEQNRSDRDQYVSVHFDRIMPGMEYNFRTYEQRGQAGLDIGAYDFNSIMHYSSWAFSSDFCSPSNPAGCTITHHDGSYIMEHQRTSLSPGDLAGIQAMYGHCGGQTIDDHGDTLNDATQINGAGQVNGTLHHGDYDVFAVNAPAGHHVTVYTTGDTQVAGFLYEDGVHVASANIEAESDNFELTFVATDTPHHIVVGGYEGIIGDYQVHVEIENPDGTLAASTGDQLNFEIDVPAGTAELRVSIEGGTGDADLYLRQGTEPTTDGWDCRPYLNGNDEECVIENPASGPWFIALHAFADFNDLTLSTEIVASEMLEELGLSGSAGEQQFFTVDVPAGASNLEFYTSGGIGDADLYVRFGSAPTLSTYDCRPFAQDSEEHCTIENAQAGTYHVMVSGWSDFSGLDLFGTWE